MVFSSPIFLFGFLPLVLALYYLAPRSARNLVLLVASLAFYAWGEVFYVAVMLVSIAVNFTAGRLIADANAARTRIWLALGISANLALLISFKYANFIADNLNALLAPLGVPPVELAPIHLPLGISFFTFQAISYIVDVYRRETLVQRDPLDLALYITLFPQLIAGPIVRYHDVAAQIVERTHSVEVFGSGVQRFIFGLAKKMLIANPMGEVADKVFALPATELTAPLAWIGVLAYSLQIYFDFSGYSDMAIGLGRMFGFRFLENFNHPYIARSLREFWRRWHISLSSWFRDYVYIPLGGGRVSTPKVLRNLLVVFLLTGVWHGASWNFVVWGLFHGAFLTLEHQGFSRVLERLWRPLQHAYLLFVVALSWVFFRADTLGEALAYLGVLFDPGRLQTAPLAYAAVLSPESVLIFALAILFALPAYTWVRQRLVALSDERVARLLFFVHLPRLLGLTLLLALCLLKVSASTYNPFIYFRF